MAESPNEMNGQMIRIEGARPHERVMRMIVAEWPQPKPVRRTSLDEYNLYRSLDQVSQRCWLFSDKDELYVVLFIELKDAPFRELNIRLRAGKEPLVDLDEQQIAQYVMQLADDLSTPQKVKRLTWDEATGKSHRLAWRVPFSELAAIHFLACLTSGQKLTSRFVDSTIEQLRKPSKAWKRPDIVAIEEDWDQEKPRDYARRIVALAFEMALRERDQLRAQLSRRMVDD